MRALYSLHPAQAMTFFLAGHETTSQLLSWVMLMLCKHPEWADRVLEDILDHCPMPHDPTMDQLRAMKVVDQVIWETLRLFPPAPLLGRVCVRTHKLGDLVIEKGVQVVIPVATIHTDEEFWDDPQEFRPERFANGVADACRHRFAFLPFSSGVRNCIGQQFALLEAKAILTVLLRQFKFTLDPSYRHAPQLAITLQPQFDIPIRVSLR